MSQTNNKKRIISSFIIFLLFLGVCYMTPMDVSSKDCESAYNECTARYGGRLPAPYGTYGNFYCRIGFLYCIIFLR